MTFTNSKWTSPQQWEIDARTCITESSKKMVRLLKMNDRDPDVSEIQTLLMGKIT